MFRSSALCLLAVAALTVANAQMPPTLATPGPPPDVVAAFIGNNYVGAVAANGGFTFQSAGSSMGSSSGQYLSHTCNADGSWDAVWSVDMLDPTTGALAGQTAYCEHGLINQTTYQSYFMMGTTCPLTSLAGASSRNTSELANSNLGALIGTPFCQPTLATSSLVHASAAVGAPAPTPTVTMPSPGTVSVAGGSNSAGNSGTSGTTGTP